MDVKDGYVELLIEVCCNKRKYICINGEEISTAAAKSHFLKLDKEPVSYIMKI